MTGAVTRVSGPLVEVEGLRPVAMSDLVALGDRGLPGEVVAIRDDVLTVQAYEYTGGLAAGDPVRALGRPLSATLGPHLLGGAFDGLLRPLSSAGTWLMPGSEGARARDHDDGAPGTVGAATVPWRPATSPGATAGAGDVLGVVPGRGPGGTDHLVLVPPGAGGSVEDLARAGPHHPDAPVATVGGTPVGMVQDWPVRRARPVAERLEVAEPLLTGQRVLDAVYPIARGSSAAVPGGFGTGKTMLLQQVAKWAAADVIVYVGCGERGNEMADVLGELAELTDPRTGRPLRERTVVIANTSNMPMMAREASIYTGVTVAEYFRDAGLDSVVIADSTSRWAEALREFGSRSGALPAEEGYPAELASALAAFYERAGRVRTLGGRTGSVSVIGAVSPPGGDTTEPVTAHTERFVRAVWTLDRDLAYARHYPAVAWTGSFSRDLARVGRWHARSGDPDWSRRQGRVTGLLAEADRLADLAALVGVGSLPGHERVTLLGGRLVREGVLQQNALSTNDAHCTPEKTAALVDAVLDVVETASGLVDQGVTAAELDEADYSLVLRAAADTPADDAAGVRARRDATVAGLEALR